MTRQDYILIAKALRRSNPSTIKEPINNTIAVSYMLQYRHSCTEVANALAAQSRGFDRELFLRNCGVQS